PGRPRRASVSSFGFGGSNFHCLLEESAGPKPQVETDLALVALSGDSYEELAAPLLELASLASKGSLAALDGRARELFRSFKPSQPLRFTLHGSLASLPRALEEAALALTAYGQEREASLPEGAFLGKDNEAPLLIFRIGPLLSIEPDFTDPDAFFPDLAMAFPVYQNILDLAEETLRRLKLSPYNLGRLLFPPRLAPKIARDRFSSELAKDPVLAVAVTSMEIAQGALLKSFGLKPAGLKGSSLGIIAAAQLLGLLSPQKAMEAAAAYASGDPGAGAALNALLGKKPLPVLVTPMGPVKSAHQLVRAIDEGPKSPHDLAEEMAAGRSPSKGFSHIGPRDASVFLGWRPLISDNQSLFFDPKNPLGSLASILTRLAAAGEKVDLGRWPKPSEDRPAPEGHFVMVGGANVFTPPESRPVQSPAPDLALLASLQAESLKLLKGISDKLGAPSAASHSAPHGASQSPSLSPGVQGSHPHSFQGPNPQAQAGSVIQSSLELNPAERLSPKAPSKGNGGRPDSFMEPGPGGYSQGAWETLTAVVAQETGYPPESLHPELELDNDLGLDSIKRVELLSALSERFPRLSSAGSDLSQAPTLGALAALCQSLAPSSHAKGSFASFEAPGGPAPSLFPFESGHSEDSYSAFHVTSHDAYPVTHSVTGLAPGLDAYPASHLAAETATSHNAPAPGHFRPSRKDILLEVLAQETGYPIETLDLSLQLDNDLGLDSIKKVELLSALSERLGGAPSQLMSEASTLEDLLKAIESVPPAPHGPPSQAGPSQAAASQAAAFSRGPFGVAAGRDGASKALARKSVREIVALETGYPLETLAPQLNLESDLGLDSIKKVEILSLIAEGRAPLSSSDQTRLSQAGTLADWEAFFEERDKSSVFSHPSEGPFLAASPLPSGSPQAPGSSNLGSSSALSPKGALAGLDFKTKASNPGSQAPSGRDL
ncbi:MAG: phosphopantetheine-binding protein, partial [Deltaproteobacteria bacterium]|nr:phosphopantetheine-binding protein [Deltaproteobacteria bacterium]